MKCDRECGLKTDYGYCKLVTCIHSNKFVFPDENEDCYWCDTLESGDSLYQHGSDDRGILFDEIRNIQFCPVCGRKLRSDYE